MSFNRGLYLKRWSAGLACVLLLGCSTSAIRLDAQSDTCSFDGVEFTADFPGGKLDHCDRAEDGSYVLRFDPEDNPINHSPWYAFRVSADSPQEVTVRLTYSLHGHRYWPKLSADGESWQRASIGSVDVDVDVDADAGAATLRIHVAAEPVWVAAQEIVDNDNHRRWAQELAQTGELELSVLGKSAEGRDVLKLETPASPGSTVILVGRQHPPEVTGALALQHFSKRLVESDSLAVRFREQFGILLVPNMNPDGVARGHWRHSTGGVDLNRDWGPFTQPETRLVRDEIARFADEDGECLVLFLDFHSTRYDVLYTQLPEMETIPAGFTWRWIDRLQETVSEIAPGYPIVVKPGHNPDRPTSKAYMHATYGVPAITFELGDETDREFIRSYARMAAEQMMLELLETVDNQSASR